MCEMASNTSMVKKGEGFMIILLLVLLYTNDTGRFFCPYFSAMLIFFLTCSLHSFVDFASVLPVFPKQKSTNISCDLGRTVKTLI